MEAIRETTWIMSNFKCLTLEESRWTMMNCKCAMKSLKSWSKSVTTLNKQSLNKAQKFRPYRTKSSSQTTLRWVTPQQPRWINEKWIALSTDWKKNWEFHIVKKSKHSNMSNKALKLLQILSNNLSRARKRRHILRKLKGIKLLLWKSRKNSKRPRNWNTKMQIWTKGTTRWLKFYSKRSKSWKKQR